MLAPSTTPHRGSSSQVMRSVNRETSPCGIPRIAVHENADGPGHDVFHTPNEVMAGSRSQSAISLDKYGRNNGKMISVVS